MVVRQAPILAVTNGFAFNWNDKQALCLNYFDKGGRTAGSANHSGNVIPNRKLY